VSTKKTLRSSKTLLLAKPNLSFLLPSLPELPQLIKLLQESLRLRTATRT